MFVSAKLLLHSDGLACSLCDDIAHHAIGFRASSDAVASSCEEEEALLHQRVVIWLGVCEKHFWLIHSVQP